MKRLSHEIREEVMLADEPSLVFLSEEDDDLYHQRISRETRGAMIKMLQDSSTEVTFSDSDSGRASKNTGKDSEKQILAALQPEKHLDKIKSEAKLSLIGIQSALELERERAEKETERAELLKKENERLIKRLNTMEEERGKDDNIYRLGCLGNLNLST